MFSIWFILKAIIIGFFTGFVASIPLGPSGLESINRTISEGFREGFKVSVGAVMADLVYIIIINLGFFSLFNKHRHVQSIFWIISGVVLLIFNRFSSKINDNPNSNGVVSNNTNGFVTGFLITFINPTTPSLWVALSATVFSVWRRHGRIYLLLSVISMLIGSISWFCLLNYLVSKGFKKVNSDYSKKTSNLLNYFLVALGIIFIILGFYKLLF